MEEAAVKNFSEKHPQAADAIKGAGMHMLTAFMSFAASRACIAGALAPFGLAFCGGVPCVYAASAAAGALVGYILPVTGGSGFGYVAAVFAICAIKLLIKGVGKVCKMPGASAVIALAATLTVSMAMADFSQAAGIITPAAEGLLAGVGALFVHKSAEMLSKVVSGLRLRQLSCLLLTFNMLFMGLYTVTVGQLNLGCILITATILCAAVFSGAGAGAVAGVAAGMAIMLTNPAQTVSFAVFAAAGLLAGIFAPGGKVAGGLVFVATGCLICALSGINDASAAMMLEIVFGTALYLLIPGSIAKRLGRILSPPADTSSFDGMRHALGMRLDFASKTLHDISETVDEVAGQLARRSAPDFDAVLKRTECDACRGCLMRVRCWETLRNDTITSITELARFSREGEKPKLSKKTMEFGGRCNRMDEVMNVINRHYNDYLVQITAQSRADQVRKVISGQFNGISRMLFELSHEFEEENRFDPALAEEISASLHDLGLQPCECSCRIDPWERMNVEISAKADENTVINRLKLNRLLNNICGREFAAPLITRCKDRVMISASESAVFAIDTGVTQFCCPDSMICGDSYEFFEDGRGRMVMVLSDGMGHGGRAAVDSAMASGMMTRLLRAGFGYDCSLDIVNSSMLYKSADESLATMDIAAIDLFTGKTDLLKAGAAPTLLRRSGRSGKAQSTSLPAGILQEVGFDRASIKLKANDIILMLSDGAVCQGTEWICAELESWRDGTAQQLSERIAMAARSRRDDGHSDDITVLASIIKKAV